MSGLRTAPFLAAVLMLVYSQTVFSDEMTQSWVLSDPKPAANPGQEGPSGNNNEKAAVAASEFSENFYDLPNVLLIDKNGKEVDFLQVIDYGGPVMLQFIFATCSSICPVLSASFASAQPVLDTPNTPYRFVSISIDPEQDTPQKLAAYAKRFRAGNNWHFLTGDRKNIDSLLKAFRAAYPGNNKMYHKPLTFMRAKPGAPWRLFEKLLGKNEVIAAYKKLVEPALPPESDK
jgi:protein SCO1/2